MKIIMCLTKKKKKRRRKHKLKRKKYYTKRINVNPLLKPFKIKHLCAAIENISYLCCHLVPWNLNNLDNKCSNCGALYFSSKKNSTSYFILCYNNKNFKSSKIHIMNTIQILFKGSCDKSKNHLHCLVLMHNHLLVIIPTMFQNSWHKTSQNFTSVTRKNMQSFLSLIVYFRFWKQMKLN